MIVNRPVIIQGNVDFARKSDLQGSTSIPATVNFVRLNGHTSAGDNGHGLYKRSASEPSHNGKAQDATNVWWELVENVVTLEMFGATGLDATLDGAALTSAIAYLNAFGGGKIRGKSGRTYYFTEIGGSPGLTTTTPIEIDLNGATFKRPDSVMTADFKRMITFRLTSVSARLKVYGGTIDANWAGNVAVAPVGSTAVEHNASIFVWIVAAGVPYVGFRDMKLKDRWQFDHLSVYATSTYYVEQVTFDNIVSETTYSPALRADIIWAENCRNVRIDGVAVERIESEYDAAPGANSIVSIKNAECSEAMQLAGFSAATASTVKMYLDNVTAAETDVSYLELFDKDCDFGEVNSWNPSKWRSHDSKFEVANTGFPAQNVGSLVADHVDVDWHITRPIFRLVSGPQTSTNPAIRFPVILSTYEDFTFVLDEPDFIDDFGLIGTPHGNVTFRNPKVKQLGLWAFGITGVAGRVVNVTIDGGDYSQCTAAPIRLDGFDDAGYKLTLKGDWIGGEAGVTSSGVAHAAANIFNHRRIFGSAEPTSSILGDELHILPPPTDGTATVRKATNTSTAAATWVAYGQTNPITSVASTPSFVGQFAVAAGVGYMATGTSSSADWKQITA
jgi:hypothetical protein